MTEPRHRKRRRRRGLALSGGRGRRRQSGILETSTRGARQLRRSAEAAASQTSRRRVLLASAGAVVMVAAAVVASWYLLRSSPDEPLPGAEPPISTGGSVLLVVTDEAGRGRSLALVAVHPDRADRVVLFPPSLVTLVPGFGERELADASRFGGAELAQLTVMNLLGARVDDAVVLSSSELADRIATPLEFDLPAPLVVPDGEGERVLVAAGRAVRAPEVAVALLLDQGVSDQLTWLLRQGAVWNSLLGEMAERAALVGEFAAGSASARQVLSDAAADPELLVTGIPVARVEPTGGDTERYQASSLELEAFLRESVPYLALREGPRARVEVLNGNGRIGTTRPVAASLIREGFRVTKTDNADASDYDVSRVIAHGLDHQQDAVAAQELLGVGQVEVEQRQPSTVVDVTIIVGLDIPAEEV